jgi:hypothetical protein
LLAPAAEDHLHVIDGESATVPTGDAQALELERQVAHAPTTGTDEVVVLVLHVGVDAYAPSTEVEHVYFSQRLEIVNGLVHGLERDRGHVGARLLVERLDGGVLGVSVEQAKDGLSLRRDAQALFAKQVRQLVARLHDSRTLSTMIVENQVGMRTALMRGAKRAMLRPCS